MESSKRVKMESTDWVKILEKDIPPFQGYQRQVKSMNQSRPHQDIDTADMYIYPTPPLG